MVPQAGALGRRLRRWRPAAVAVAATLQVAAAVTLQVAAAVTLQVAVAVALQAAVAVTLRVAVAVTQFPRHGHHNVAAGAANNQPHLLPRPGPCRRRRYQATVCAYSAQCHASRRTTYTQVGGCSSSWLTGGEGATCDMWL